MPVPVFTSGEILTAANMNAVGLWRITGCTASSVGGTSATASNGVVTIGTGNTSVTVNSAFSSDYNAYKIIVSNGVGSVSANIGLSLGSSITSYYSGGAVFGYAAGAQQNIFDNNAVSWARAGQMSANAINLDVTLVDPFLAKTTKISYIYALPDTTQSGGHGAGFHNVATSYTSFVITPSTGTLTGGTIRVYGYNN